MNFEKRKTILLSLIIAFMGNFIILSILPKIFGYVLSLDSDNLTSRYAVGIIVRLIGLILGILIIKKLKIFKKINSKIDKKTILISWLFIIYILFNIEIVNIKSNMILNLNLMIIEGICIGFFEEIVFRGIILSLFLKQWNNNKKEIYFSVIFSSVLFGLIHLLNILSGNSIIEVLYQVIYASIIGIYFSVLLIRTNFNIIWCAILHSLYDIASGFGDLVVNTTVNTPSSILPYIINLLFFLPLLIYALLSIKKVNFTQKIQIFK